MAGNVGTKKKTPVYDKELYLNKSIHDLILLSLYALEETGEKQSFEEIIKKSFELFPDIFSFEKYREWPDARKIDRPLRELRERKLITGDPRNSFCLTNSGKKIAKEAAKGLGQKKLL